MHFIKLSSSYINLDNVTNVISKDGLVIVYFTASDGDRTYSRTFEGRDADTIDSKLRALSEK